MASIPNEFHDLFDKQTFAHIATVLPNDELHVTPVWVDFDPDNNHILVNTERGRRKEKNVRNDSRVAISMTDPDNPYRMLSVTGEVVDITTDGARDHIDKIAKRYTGEDEYPNPIETERVLIVIEPKDVSHYGG